MWDWYNIFNLTEWLATGLISRKLSIFLEGRETKEILITQGNETAIQVDDLFLPLNFQGKNPWKEGTTAVWVDADNNVWLGYEVQS